MTDPADSPRILAADAPLADAQDPESFSLMTWNVLLPNSFRGWWVYKFYEPDVPRECSAWPHRQVLIARQFAAAQADVVCVQEAIPESFDADFAFAAEHGYDRVLHAKGDLRCATFWRRSRFEPADAPKHADRTLVTPLREVAGERRTVHVVNVHLKAGGDAARRLRQTEDALEVVHKWLRARGRPSLRAAVVVAGDFNASPDGSAVCELLARGAVAPAFREPGLPDVALTTRERTQPFGRFEDAYSLALGDAAPPTMRIPVRDEFFGDQATGGLSRDAESAMRALFRRFAGSADVLDRAGVERWISAVNGQPGRGSEWDKAMAVFAAKGHEALGEDDMVALYTAELAEGKPWGVIHDLHATGVLPVLPPHRVWAERVDRVHYTTESLALAAVRDPLTAAQWATLKERNETLPNAWHPSDHLPVAAVLRWRAG